MSNVLPASFRGSCLCLLCQLSILTERSSLLENVAKKMPVCILEGWKGNLMILWLMIEGSWVWEQHGVEGEELEGEPEMLDSHDIFILPSH